MISLTKGYSAGVTALVYAGETALEGPVVAEILAPLTGVGADVLVWLDPAGTVRTFDPTGASVPSPRAAVRLAAAHRIRAGNSDLRFTVDGRTEAVTYAGGEFSLDQGRWSIPGGAEAIEPGSDATIHAAGMSQARPGLQVAIGGRTITVVAFGSAAELSALDFSRPPNVEPATDLVAFVSVMGERAVDLLDVAGNVVGTEKVGAVQIRGYDLVLGEIFSSDALAGATAAAIVTWFGEDSAREWISVFAMGTTRAQLAGERVLTSSEATLVADVTWLG